MGGFASGIPQHSNLPMDHNQPEQARGRWAEPASSGKTEARASSEDGELPEGSANFAAAMRLGIAGGSQGRASENDVTVDYGAVEVPSIPEPASGIAIAVLIGVLVATRQLAGVLNRNRGESSQPRRVLVR
ncbi:MAG: hypothetical protein H0T11_01365 [Chthoniobacterales bacterium]|nr:hypothetical protein [Chthoniobacterales bacterium]